MLHDTWGLSRSYVTWVTWCDGRTVDATTIQKYYQPSNECLRARSAQGDKVQENRTFDDNFEDILNFRFKEAQICAAISHTDALSDMLANGYQTALVLEDDTVFDPEFPSLLQDYLPLLDPDWGVLFTDAATSCHWWEKCADLGEKRAVPSVYRRSVPQGAFGGAILWHRRAAKAVVKTLEPFCLPWDMEIEFHFRIHNVSVWFASPSLVVQGSFLNPGEKGFTGSSLHGERNPDYTPPPPPLSTSEPECKDFAYGRVCSTENRFPLASPTEDG